MSTDPDYKALYEDEVRKRQAAEARAAQAEEKLAKLTLLCQQIQSSLNTAMREAQAIEAIRNSLEIRDLPL